MIEAIHSLVVLVLRWLLEENEKAKTIMLEITVIESGE